MEEHANRLMEMVDINVYVLLDLVDLVVKLVCIQHVSIYLETNTFPSIYNILFV